MANPAKKPSLRRARHETAPSVADAGDEIDQLVAKRDAMFRDLFPGDAERAKLLGRTVGLLTSPILSYLLSAKEPDRSQMRRAIHVEIASFARPMGTPTEAPRLWSDRDAGDTTNPAEFIRKHYKRWIGFGLTRKDLRDLDPQLYHALSVWEHRHPEDRINELPTVSEVIDEKILALSTEFSEDELRKLGTTLQTRLRRLQN